MPSNKVLPAVTADAVKSTVEGEQTAAGFVITKAGNGLIVAVTGTLTLSHMNAESGAVYLQLTYNVVVSVKEVGSVIGLPPVGAVYHCDSLPMLHVAVRVNAPGPQREAPCTVGGAGVKLYEPPTKSSNEAVNDCDDLHSSKKLELHLFAPPIKFERLTYPS